MTERASLSEVLPLRNVPLLGAAAGLGMMAMPFVGLAGLAVGGTLDLSSPGDELWSYIVGGPVFVLLGLYVVIRNWNSWTSLTFDGTHLHWSGGHRRLSIPPDAVVGITVLLSYPVHQVFQSVSIVLELDGPDLPDRAQIGRYRFAGAGLLQRTYRLASAMGLPVNDPNRRWRKAHWLPPLRWLGEGRGWMTFLFVAGIIFPLPTLFLGNILLAVAAFASGLLMSGLTLLVGLRRLELDEPSAGRRP